MTASGRGTRQFIREPRGSSNASGTPPFPLVADSLFVRLCQVIALINVPMTPRDPSQDLHNLDRVLAGKWCYSTGVAIETRIVVRTFPAAHSEPAIAKVEDAVKWVSHLPGCSR
jgi:hypothetical protein